jgi:hypothetical protein
MLRRRSSRVKRAAAGVGPGNASAAGSIQSTDMRWTAAWLLALAVHLAGIAAVWLCCRGARLPQPMRDAVELAVLEARLETARPEREAKRPAPARPLDHVNLHDRARAHGGVPVHVHGNDHGGDHVHVHDRVKDQPANVDVNVGVAAPVDVDVHVHGSATVGVAAPVSAPPASAPVNLNLTPNSLAALNPPPPSSATSPASLDTTTLHGTVASDGSLHIRSKSPVTVGSDLTQPGKVLDSWLKDPKAHAASRDGTAAIVRGTFDVTDSIMRAAGQDPYRAQRMKMLDETREQRMTLAVRDRTARREAELAALPTELRNIWKDGARSAKERRQLIFQLWDECQESAEGEAEGAAAGARARRGIVLFIREHLAEGSLEAYPKEELATLNLARQSRQRFDPYGRSPL